MDEEPGSTLHSAAVEHHSQMPATSHATPSTSNPYNTGLANSTLVPISTASCGSTFSTPGLTNSQPKRHREESELADDRLGPRRKEHKQFSELTEAILRRGATNNPSTVSRQRLFIAWCHLTEQEPYELFRIGGF
ncbi:hypothetical protein G6F43_014178 [Rhizopus delemar]|nr:hypothetical protein G6F43_014178 [Rhizopus delemar]